jgi:colanic acid/amylovoran biosynthesis glycosyltransferase
VTRVIYVTAQLPYGANEPFVIAEIAHLERAGCEVTVVPLRPRGSVVHGDAAALLAKATVLPLVSGTILRAALSEALGAPSATLRALASLFGSRTPHILLKNLVVFPKALWLSRYARRLGADHLHAHWAGTSGTLALLAGEISGSSWSLTTHRWDIAENNLLRLKARRACFVRAISARGAEQLRRLVDEPGWSPWQLHVGVDLPPPRPPNEAAASSLCVVTPASFLEVKGHVYLIEAVSRLKEGGAAVRAELAGDGPLEPSLRRLVGELGLENEVVFLGRVSHEELLREMSGGRWDAAVVPSVITGSCVQEGIPVSLVEAMARGLPAVGTESGGIPELLRDGAGIIVPPADSEALAEALATLAGDTALRAALAARGRERVEDEFSAERVAAALLSRFRECAGLG